MTDTDRWGRSDAPSDNRNPTRSKGLKLDMDQAREIKRLLSEGYPVIVIAEKFGVTDRTIRKIRAGEYWRDA